MSNVEDKDNNNGKRNKRQKLNPTDDGSSCMASILRDQDLMRMEILPFLDVVSLVNKKVVCEELKDHCSYAIDAKTRTTATTTTRPKSFENGEELKQAIKKYIKGDRNELEDVATMYGYPIGKWDVSQVEYFSRIFWSYKEFNEDIGSWNTSNATKMEGLFYGASSFNKDISRWNVSNVRDMSCMFCRAETFNQELAMWDVSNVTSMFQMFAFTKAFNQDLAPWDVSNVCRMDRMFYYASAFNHSLSRWDVSRVRCMEIMFCHATSLNDDNRASIQNWNIADGTGTWEMLGGR